MANIIMRPSFQDKNIPIICYFSISRIQKGEDLLSLKLNMLVFWFSLFTETDLLHTRPAYDNYVLHLQIIHGISPFVSINITTLGLLVDMESIFQLKLSYLGAQKQNIGIGNFDDFENVSVIAAYAKLWRKL